MLNDTRIRPLAQVRVYDPGMGDPRFLDEGWGWYDILRDSFKWGSFTPATGTAALEVIPEVGMVCRPWIGWSDTPRSSFVFNGGTWENRTPLVGVRVARLAQIDATPNLNWAATSSFALPRDPNFCVSVKVMNTPGKQDDGPNTFTRFEFGGVWAIEWHATHGARFMLKKGGVWQAVMKLSGGTPPKDAGFNDEQLWLVRCQRGMIGISGDLGKTYDWHADPKGAALVVDSTPFTWRGNGRVAIFGLHPLNFYAGSYTPARNRTNRLSRPQTNAPVITPKGNERSADGCAWQVENTSSADGTWAQYRLTLTPGTAFAGPYTFSYSPDVQAVAFEYPALLQPVVPAYTTPWPDLLSVVIDKPVELHASTCTIKARITAAPDFDKSWKWRKIEVLLGEANDQGDTLAVRFVGYLRTASVKWVAPGEALLTAVLDNGLIQAKRRKWDSALPFAGVTPNEMITYVAARMGMLDPLDLDAKGDQTVIPFGAHEKPGLWPKPTDTFWETLQAIAKRAGVEIGWKDAGGIYTIPLNATVNAPATYKATPTAVLENITEIEQRFDSTLNYTGVLVFGEGDKGSPITARLLSNDLDDPAAKRFSPWPELRIEQLDGTATAQGAQDAILGLYYETIPRRFEPELVGEGRLDVVRRSVITVEGTDLVGVKAAQTYVATTIRHEYAPTFDGVKTTVGLRRL